MKATRILLIVFATILVILLVAGGCVYRGYNTAVAMDENVNSSWAQVENVLKRRFDLIPNLVETVKGVAQQEQDVYLGVAEARQAYTQARTVGEKAQATGLLNTALSRLLAIREAYPELKSNQAFQNLQVQLEGTENRIAVERKRYNDAVRQLNTFRRTLTGRFYASLAGVEKAEYFEITEAEQETPRVDFSRE